MKKKYLIKFEWKIERIDKRNGYRTGTTSIILPAKNKVEAINYAIDFASGLPSWELEKNHINEHEYVDNCKVMYTTQITKFISIENYKEEKLYVNC